MLNSQRIHIFREACGRLILNYLSLKRNVKSSKADHGGHKKAYVHANHVYLNIEMVILPLLGGRFIQISFV